MPLFSLWWHKIHSCFCCCSLSVCQLPSVTTLAMWEFQHFKGWSSYKKMPKVVFNEVLKFQKIGLTVLSQLSLQYFNTPRVCYPYLIIDHQNKIDRTRCRLKLQRSICDEGFQQSSLVCCCLVGVGGAPLPMWGLCRLSLFLIFFVIGMIFFLFLRHWHKL